jgi:hypothetical protein
VERGVYFDAWYPRQHCYHPSLPPRRLRMIDDLVDYRATVLVWSALGGGSLALPYLEQEAFGAVEPRSRFYGFVNDSEFIAACRQRGIKVFGIVFEAQGWEFPVELDDDESTVLALNELRGVGRKDWLGLREFSANRYPNLWPPVESYFPEGLINSRGEVVTDLIEECVSRDIHGRACHARWVECPDREHECYYMDRNNPVWRQYLKAVIKIQIDAGVDGVQLDEAELPLGALQYGACFCIDCTRGFRDHLRRLPAERRPPELAGVDLDTFSYGPWLLEQGYDFVDRQKSSPLFGHYYAFQCAAIARYFAELADYAREYGRSVGREVLVSGNFFNLDPQYLPLADHVDLIVTEMRNTTYRQPEWFRYAEAFARTVDRPAGVPEVVVVENPYGGVVPELVEKLAAGRAHDRMRLSLFEAAAFGANMTVPYGSWLGATLEDSFWAPHGLLVAAQDFLAGTDGLRSAVSANELAVVYSVPSMRDLVAKADLSDNLTNTRDLSVAVPYRVATETLSRAGAPFDVVLATDGELAPDRFGLSELSRYRTVALPGCWWLTENQLSTLISYLEAGGCVVGTDEPALNLDAGLRERLLRHPRYRRAAVDGPSTLQPLGPQVVAAAELAVHLQRGEAGVVACHLINYGYDEQAEAVAPLTEVQLDVRLTDVAVGPEVEVRRPDAAPVRVPVQRQGEYWRCTLPEIGIYAIVVFTTGSPAGSATDD